MSGRLAKVDLARQLERSTYERELLGLQYLMRSIQLAYRDRGLRGIVVIEGWDASGKGGLIRRMVHEMDPRACTVWPIGPPSAEEQERHYLYRFWARLPAAGTIAVFDRSWYGRVLVERVEKLAKEAAWQRAYGEINEFERLLTDDGVRIVKLFMHLSAEEQAERFRERARDPHKRWKLTPEDLLNRELRPAYETAIEEMFEKTSTAWSTWQVVSAEQKRHGRIQALRHITAELSRGVDLEPPPLAEAFRGKLIELLDLPPDFDRDGN